MPLKLFLFCLFINSISFCQSSNSKPFVLGKTEVIESTLLKEKRIVNVYLPEGYSASDTISYPVVYLLDGSADEDFIHVAGLYQFYSFSWIRRVPNSIVVGIANVDRKRDFTFPSGIREEQENYKTAGHSKSFISFIKNELQPFIQKHYRSSDDKTLIGQSLAGLLATEILLYQPELFNRYIIISPSLWWNDGSLLKGTKDNLVKNHLPGTRVYIGVGKEGLAPSTLPHVMEVDANLLAEKLRSYKIADMKVMFDYLPDENHATISHQAILNAFKLVYSTED